MANKKCVLPMYNSGVVKCQKNRLLYQKLKDYMYNLLLQMVSSLMD